ncbi:MAG: glucan biosynthesis protein G [Paracoccus sp. (in: a-proteobacteria)]|uniref:glucan biosynthesis protein n=1 Tax=Paracoccus sp. TaxID=267 RepID=UPI0026E034C8|nr:glucan biosynthesis protein G [Paracoccus sp. (in: a-proteobacteria)]MDO5612893.1 glucan biosynthesis protein G [Paracoccus sp. (in: a-proteobacteria)]
MDRRDFLTSASALAAATAAATLAAAPAAHADQAEDAGAAASLFDFDALATLTAERAAAPYTQPVADQVGSFANLNYDQYRAIRFRRDADPLAGHPRFGLDLLAPGSIFYEPIQINLLREGVVVPIPFDPHLLEFDPSQFPDGADLDTVGKMGWSGFRMRCPLNRPDVRDEFLVFQGASYFRAVARGTLYGLSARGLAIDTGSPRGEEFPLFTDFWIEEPAPDAESVRIYAMLDSKSLAGAFQFDVTPGAETVIRVRMALFPRADVTGVGIAPLTSMFWFGPASRAGVDDYRPAVHDSDGLAMRTGAGQDLWRALSNHKALQIASFVDRNPTGFGLQQRARSFADYQDAEAHYQLRPSAWIEPIGNWGEGVVRLIEIPVENEFNDNIVSYWQPKSPLTAGQRADWSYRLVFAPLVQSSGPVAQVRGTRAGKSINSPTGRSFIIDYDLAPFQDQLPQIAVNTSSGEVVHAYLKPLVAEGVLRLAFEFEPRDARMTDLRATLTDPEGTALSETWMARWSV